MGDVICLSILGSKGSLDLYSQMGWNDSEQSIEPVGWQQDIDRYEEGTDNDEIPDDIARNAARDVI